MNEKLDNVDEKWFRAEISKKDLNNYLKKVILKDCGTSLYISYYYFSSVICQLQPGELGGQYYGYGYMESFFIPAILFGMSAVIELHLNQNI